MSSAFIFQNQYHQFLTKSNEWVDGSESQTLLKTLHKDEALNIKAEQSVKNPELRLSIVGCELNSKGHPQIKLPAVNDKPSVCQNDTPLTEDTPITESDSSTDAVVEPF